ncbi:MAG: dihydrofolate reductase, partial [Woeseia sp.]
WHLPEDLKRFRSTTMGKPIVMGRLTHESIGKALPGRRNIVISRQPGYTAVGCEVVASPEAALAAAAGEDEVMIIGGGRIYEQMLPMTDRIYLTRVRSEPNGDAFFPALNESEWQLVESEDFPAGPTRQLGFSVDILQRVTD